MAPAARPRPPARRRTAPKPVVGRGEIFSFEHAQLRGKDGQPARPAVKAMLDRGIRELTGKSKVADAWASLFSAKDIVAVKPNTLGKDCYSPSRALLSLIVERLRDAGVKPGNITIWDRSHFEGTELYAWLKAGKGYKGELAGVRVGLQESFGYADKPVKIASGPQEKLTKVITEATAVVNVPVWKDHGIAGVTGALKNLAFGIMPTAQAYHPDACTPGIGEFYQLPEVGQKVRLTVADVHHLLYNGGPFCAGPSADQIKDNRLLLTRDPVALDRLQWEHIDKVRKSKGMPLLMKRNPGLKMGSPHHVEHAARLGLGEADFSRIRVKAHKLG